FSACLKTKKGGTMDRPAPLTRSVCPLAQHFPNSFRRLADDFFGLRPCQAKRRSKAENIALWHGSADDAALEESRSHAWPDLLFGAEEASLLAIFDKLDGAQHALSADLADMRMIAERCLHRFVEERAGLACILHQPE